MCPCQTLDTPSIWSVSAIEANKHVYFDSSLKKIISNKVIKYNETKRGVEGQKNNDT